jgi:hypothetical protein
VLPQIDPGEPPQQTFSRPTRPQLAKEPTVSSSLTPPARVIDPRGQRFGAGVFAVLFVVSIVTGQFWIAALLGLNLLVAAAFGTRLFLPGRPWRVVRTALRLGPTEPEHEYPPRFAQALGGTFIALGTILFLSGIPVAGWVLVGAVAALQTLLATTGYCVGCKLYFLRWWVPSLFARLFRRQDQRLGIVVQPLQRVR